MNKIYLKEIIFLSIITLWFIFPLSQYKTLHGGSSADPIAHSAQMPWFCDNFFKRNFYTTQFLAPVGVNLANSYDMPLWMSVGCIFKPLGPVAMYNAIAALQIILIVAAAYWVSRLYLNSSLLRLAFVMLILFSSFVQTRSVLHINILSTVWSVLIIIAGFKALDIRQLKHNVIAALLFSAILLSTWQNIATTSFLILALIVKIIRQSDKRFLVVRNILGIVAVAGVLSLYFIAPMIAEDKNALRDFNQFNQRHADLTSYLLPWISHPLYPLFPQAWSDVRDFEHNIALDPIIAILLIGIFFNPKHRQSQISYKKTFLVLTLGYIVLSFGHQVSFLNQVILPLPYYPVLARMPPLFFTRIPARFGVVPLIIVSLMVLQIFDNKTMRNLKLVVIGYCITMFLILSPQKQYPVFAYQQFLPQKGLMAIKKDTQSTYVYHLPPSIDVDTLQNFLQLYHQKNLLTGYVSYRALNSKNTQLIKHDPILKLFDCPLAGDPPQLTDAPKTLVSSLHRRLIELNAPYLIVNSWLLNLPRCGYIRPTINLIFNDPTRFTLLDSNPVISIFRLNP